MVNNMIKRKINNIRNILKTSIEFDKIYIIVVLLEALSRAVSPFFIILMTKAIVEEITNSKRFDVAINYVIFYSLLYFGTKEICALLSWVRSTKSQKFYDYYKFKISRKSTQIDLDELEQADVLEKMGKSDNAIWYGSIGILNHIVNIFSFIFQLIGYIYLFIIINPIFLIFILCAIILELVIEYKNEKKIKNISDEMITYNRKTSYLLNIMTTHNKGKDIRIYSAKNKFLNLLKSNNAKIIKNNKRNLLNNLLYNSFRISLTNIVKLIFYVYFLYLYINNIIKVSDLFIYITTIEAFYNSISNTIKSISGINYYEEYINDLFEFINLKTKYSNHGEKVPDLSNGFCIEMVNVSYRYKNSENFALKNINLKISSKEKISIIGDNGAGKTTLIKLIMRLYEPTEGVILLNGVNISEYDYEAYNKLFSTVFQDFKIFSISIAENITFKYNNTAEDIKQVNNVMSSFNAGDIIEKLPNKAFTIIDKSYDESGIELSGGQAQKIAFARALYKDSAILILDEPTSNLDPKSEYELFQALSNATYDKTTIYITHRISSCKFSDTVYVMDKGEIIESGNPQMLLNKTDGHYKNLWNTQAQYYNLQV